MVRFDREDDAGGTDGLREAEREVASARADVREPDAGAQLERSDDQVRRRRNIDSHEEINAIQDSSMKAARDRGGLATQSS